MVKQHEDLGLIPNTEETRFRWLTRACNCSFWEVETEESEVQGHWLCRKFRAA